MQAVVVLPSARGISSRAAWQQTLFRPVAGLPLLVRVLTTAARGGVESVVIAYPLGLDPDWLRQQLRTPLLAGVPIQLVQIDRDAGTGLLDWECLAPVLDETWLWLPWNVVSLKRTSAESHPADGPGAAVLNGPVMVVTRSLLDEYQGRLPAYLHDCALAPARPAGVRSIAVDSDRSALAAERMLIHGSGQPTDGIFSTFNRRLCRPAIQWLLKTPVTANMVSVAAMVVVAVAGYAYAQGHRAGYVAGAVIHFFAVLLDEIDGMLARTKFQESAFGSWLGTMSGYLGYLCLWLGMSVGLWRQFGDPIWLALGALTLVMSVLVFAVLIDQRKRASTPNAFNGQLMERLEADSENFVSRLIRLLSFLPRKAVMSHYLIWFTLLGLLPLFVSLTAVGSVFTLVFAVYSNRFFRRLEPA